MDDQAEKLRQLVHTVRHAATLATGPALLLVYTNSDRKLGDDCVQCLSSVCRTRGIAISQVNAASAASKSSDWQLAQLHGTYNIADHELWQRASVLIVVTHADDESIVDCYKSLKLASEHTPLPPLELVVLSDYDWQEATTAAERLQQTCRRFLRCSIAGLTLGMPTEDWTHASGALVDRLAMMAPVAPAGPHSPLAVDIA